MALKACGNKHLKFQILTDRKSKATENMYVEKYEIELNRG